MSGIKLFFSLFYLQSTNATYYGKIMFCKNNNRLHDKTNLNADCFNLFDFYVKQILLHQYSGMSINSSSISRCFIYLFIFMWLRLGQIKKSINWMNIISTMKIPLNIIPGTILWFTLISSLSGGKLDFENYR